MRPISSFYYIKENKGRSAIIIFMFFLTTMLFLAGNYIKSVYWFWDKANEYSDKAVLIEAVTTDTDFRDFYSYIDDLKADDDLTVLMRSSRGFRGLEWTSTLGFDMGSVSYVVESVDDLKVLFEHLGIECDFEGISEGSVIMSKSLAGNRGYHVGDTVSVSNGKYSFDAQIDDDSFILFYVVSDPDNSLRAYVLSDTLEGDQLRAHLDQVRGSRKITINKSTGDTIEQQFRPFTILFYVALILLSVIMSVTVNSVLTGHYIKRNYEFGIYRALGRSKRDVFLKVFCEIITMDLIAVAVGAAVVFLLTFMLNELVYYPSGKILPYRSDLGTLGFLISNLLVVIPSILSKSRRMNRADITEF